MKWKKVLKVTVSVIVYALGILIGLSLFCYSWLDMKLPRNATWIQGLLPILVMLTGGIIMGLSLFMALQDCTRKKSYYQKINGYWFWERKESTFE